MSSLIQFQGLFAREMARIFRIPLQTFGTPIINAALYFMIFGLSLSRSITTIDGVSYLAFLIPGLMTMSVIKNAFDNAASGIIGPKYVNDLQDLRTTPLSISQISFAKNFASLSRGLIVGLITYIIGQAFFFLTKGSFLTISSPLILIYFLLTGGLSFGFLGVAIGMWSRSFEQIGAVSALILLPLIYLGGVFFTLDHLDPTWQKLSLFNPLFYFINGVRYGVLGTIDIDVFKSILVAFLFLLITFICAHIALRKGTNYLR